MRTLTAITAAAAVLLGMTIAPLANANVKQGTERTTSASTRFADDGIALRRDGSKADPFVPISNPTPASTAVDGFDWDDAAAGAVGAMALVLLGSTAWISTHRRRGHITGADPA